jgi:hypothetical protein
MVLPDGSGMGFVRPQIDGVALVLASFGLVPASIILGTIGRRNFNGRQSATLARRIGCAICVLSLLGDGLFRFTGGDPSGGIIFCLGVLAIPAGNLGLLIIDRLLGTA